MAGRGGEKSKNLSSTYNRHPRNKFRNQFEKTKRRRGCFSNIVGDAVNLIQLDEHQINRELMQCPSIELQMISLRKQLQLRSSDIEYRLRFVRGLLSCLYKHHGVVYQGVLYGSTVNGLGHRDSDIDLRLRPLVQVSRDSNTYEPLYFNDELIDLTLKNIAYQTRNCYPSVGVFVPSTRCPLTKLKFVKFMEGSIHQDGLSIDITMLAVNSLGSFNSRYLRFLCKLEPKFHILALVLRHWSKTQKLILPGRLSSYALINMLIFFCQSISPPLLPTVDEMREMYFKHDRCIEASYGCITKHDASEHRDYTGPNNRALTQVESQCLICMHQECYASSKNEDPTSLLLLKFFEFYLKFPYSTHIITARLGRAITMKEFPTSTLYNPKFPIKQHLNIQDPFDMKHNLTAGMGLDHFHRLITTIKCSYEVLYKEILNECNQTKLSSQESKRMSGKQKPALLEPKKEDQEDLSTLMLINRDKKKIEHLFYAAEQLTKEEIFNLLEVMKPYIKNDRETIRKYDMLTNLEDHESYQSPTIHRALKTLIKDTLKNLRAIKMAKESKSMKGLTRIFMPMVPTNLKLPRQEPKESPTNLEKDAENSKSNANTLN